MKSIRGQLTLTLLSGFALLLTACGSAIYFSTRAALLNEFDAGLRAKALTIMSLTEQGRDGIQAELPEAFFEGPNHDGSPQFYELWQSNGRICARSASLKDTNLPRRFGSPSAPAYWNLSLPGHCAGRAVGLRFSPKAEDDAAKGLAPQEAILVVAADRGSLDRTLASLASVLAVAGLLTICMTVPVVKFSLRRGHAPLGELSQKAAAITADSLQTRFPVDSIPEELQPITGRLNDLLGRLEESFARERRFSADLAHELRTPLAELRSHAEVELAWPEGGAAEKHRETLDIALQMEAMVTRLLELARCENGKISLRGEPVLVAPLLGEVWRPLAGRAKEKGLAMNCDVCEGAAIQTDRTLFRAILANLFSNAVEYAPQGGQVEIVWRSEARELTVSNTVEDLTAADVPHLFERLWRKDKSRTSHEHCGLGLALSREFAALLGFSLAACFTGERTLTLSLKAGPGWIFGADRTS